MSVNCFELSRDEIVRAIEERLRKLRYLHVWVAVDTHNDLSPSIFIQAVEPLACIHVSVSMTLYQASEWLARNFSEEFFFVLPDANAEWWVENE